MFHVVLIHMFFFTRGGLVCLCVYVLLGIFDLIPDLVTWCIKQDKGFSTMSPREKLYPNKHFVIIKALK